MLQKLLAKLIKLKIKEVKNAKKNSSVDIHINDLLDKSRRKMSDDEDRRAKEKDSLH